MMSSPPCHNTVAGSTSLQQSQLGSFPHGHPVLGRRIWASGFLLVESILCSLLIYNVLMLRMLSQKQHLGEEAWCRIIKNNGI